jgi:chromosome partitioning protein
MLASMLRNVEHKYDYILIDCLPSLGLLAINALRASNGIVIPVQADFLAMQGLAQIFETIAAVREQLNPDLNIYGVLLTLVDHRTSHSRDVVKVVRSSLAGQVNVFQTEVRLHVALKETAKAGRSILDYDSSSPSADAYRRLAAEVLTVCGDEPNAPLAFAETEREPANLLELPYLVAPEVEENDSALVAVHDQHASAPSFESFVMEGWQRWLGASS